MLHARCFKGIMDQKRRRLKGKQPIPADDDDDDDLQVLNVTLCAMFLMRAYSYGLHPKELKSMLSMGVPIALFNILWVLQNKSASDGYSLDFIEFFSGCGQIRDALLRRGQFCTGFDITDDETFENFISAAGLLCAIELMRLLRRYGGCHWATVCSSWVWICRSTTKRSMAFPLGIEPRCRAVEAGKIMVSNMAVLLLWALAKKVSWVVEQPGTSLMFEHPRFKQVKDAMRSSTDPRFQWTTETVYMGAHGANSSKPTMLVASSPWIRGLVVPLTEADKLRMGENDEEIVTRDDAGGITGGKDLKATQEYPRGYGEAVAKEWMDFNEAPIEVSDSDTDNESEIVYPEATHDLWLDSSLSGVCKLLGVPAHVLLR